jgi:hypothetical protein
VEIRIKKSTSESFHCGRPLGNILLQIGRGELEEVAAKEPEAVVAAKEPVSGPTEWKLVRGTFSQKLNVTGACSRCKQGIGFFSREALAKGWQHCRKVEFAPEDLAPQWKRQEELDNKAAIQEAAELEEKRARQNQDEERAKVHFV